MEDLSAIPGPVRADDRRQPRPTAAPENRRRPQLARPETDETDEPIETEEPGHHLDVSV